MNNYDYVVTCKFKVRDWNHPGHMSTLEYEVRARNAAEAIAQAKKLQAWDGYDRHDGPRTWSAKRV